MYVFTVFITAKKYPVSEDGQWQWINNEWKYNPKSLYQFDSTERSLKQTNTQNNPKFKNQVKNGQFENILKNIPTKQEFTKALGKTAGTVNQYLTKFNEFASQSSNGNHICKFFDI